MFLPNKPYICNLNKSLQMRELITRTVSGAVVVALIVGSILLSPLAYAVLMFFVVMVGTFELCRMGKVLSAKAWLASEMVVMSAYVLGAAFALDYAPVWVLWLLIPVSMLPFLMALFSRGISFAGIASSVYGALFYLALPSVLMLLMYSSDIVGDFCAVPLLLVLYILIWTNDTFAYLTGSLVGRHKLFPRISPGKTIEGCIGGLVFTVIAICIYSYYTPSLPMTKAVVMALIAVVAGTLGDLCESMLKRQAGVKDSGRLIPGHGGILDRFDSVMFATTFIFTYLVLTK